MIIGYLLSEVFRAKLRAALAKAGVDSAIDPAGWERPWTVHVQQIGRGEHAVRYLARYVYRVALSNHALERFADGRVTFRYLHAQSQETKHQTLPVDVFIGRFLQHVLASGFTKVRSYGLLSPTSRPELVRARALLTLHGAPSAPLTTPPTTVPPDFGCAQPGTWPIQSTISGVLGVSPRPAAVD
jgi:hypothetical protein